MKAFIGRAGVYIWHTTVCAVILASMICIFWAVSYAISVHHRRQAERLLVQVAALPSGEKGVLAVRQIAHDYGGSEHCTDRVCTYDFENSFGVSRTGASRLLRRTEWDYFGLRPWHVTARMQTQGNELVDVELMAAVGRGQGWLYNEGLTSGNMWATLAVGVTINADRFDQRKDSAVGSGEHLAPGSGDIILIKPSFDTPGGGQAIEAYLSPRASGSRSVAFDLNLRCATTMTPCQNLCQLAPSMWRSYIRFAESNGFSPGESEACVAADPQ